jgi:hypothetical protein
LFFLFIPDIHHFHLSQGQGADLCLHFFLAGYLCEVAQAARKMHIKIITKTEEIDLDK